MGTTETAGERVLPATRRPDGTMRKSVRIRAGYIAQEEVAIYQSKGALWKNSGPQVPPGYDPEQDTSKPKSKTAKKNEKRKEKRKQAKLRSTADPSMEVVTEDLSKLNVLDPPLAVSSPASAAAAPAAETAAAAAGAAPAAVDAAPASAAVDSAPASAAASIAEDQGENKEGRGKPEVEKKIRALKKKIRLASEGQPTGDKLAKLEAWGKQIKELEKAR